MKNKFWNFVDNGDSAELQLFGTISSEEDWWSEDCVTYRDFIAELKALGKKTNINVLINSGGGDVFAANAIYTALVTNGAKITATVIGLCASAATIVLQAACKRRIAKNGVVMAHNPKVTLYGSYGSEDLVKLAEVTDKVKESIMSVYRDRLGKTDDEISEFYLNTLRLKNDLAPQLSDHTDDNLQSHFYDFLSVLFDVGANKSYIFDDLYGNEKFGTELINGNITSERHNDYLKSIEISNYFR